MRDKELNLFKPSQDFPFPVYPLLQVHLYFPGAVSVHVANLWQSSWSVPQIFIAVKNIYVNQDFVMNGHTLPT